MSIDLQAAPIFGSYQLAFSLFCLNKLFAWLSAFRYPDIAAYHSTFGQSDASENRCITVNDDIILENWVTRNAFDGISVVVEGKTLRAKSDALIELDIISDDTSCSDNYASSVIDGKVMAYLSSRMNVDTCFAMSLFSDDARNKGYSQQ